MPNALPHTNINLQEVSTRNEHARHIVAGFASAMPAIADIWQYLEAALADAVALSAEITRLSAELQNTRLDRANLLAAIRATLAAQADGEPDPLAYLRDELDAPETLSEDSRRRRVSTYRRMRRQARQARRSGLQPMMVINSGEPFPETVGVMLLRWAWRYRSELAPLGRHRCASWRPPGGCTPRGRTGGYSSPYSPAWPHGQWPSSARGGDCPR